MRSRLPAMLVLLCAASACKDTSKSDTVSSALASSTAAPSVADKVPPPPPPPGLDVAALESSLKCGGAGHGPCEVLREFKNCKEWLPLTDSGDGRWLGMAHIVKKGEFVDELVLLRSKRVNVTDVGPGQLNAKIAIADIPSTYAAEDSQARKALRAYERGDVPKENNQGVRYIKERTEWPDAFAMKAEENQIYIADRGGAYLCQMQTDQRLLVVRKSNTRDHPGDGLYAVLHPVSW